MKLIQLWPKSSDMAVVKLEFKNGNGISIYTDDNRVDDHKYDVVFMKYGEIIHEHFITQDDINQETLNSILSFLNGE